MFRNSRAGLPHPLPVPCLSLARVWPTQWPAPDSILWSSSLWTLIAFGRRPAKRPAHPARWAFQGGGSAALESEGLWPTTLRLCWSQTDWNVIRAPRKDLARRGVGPRPSLPGRALQTLALLSSAGATCFPKGNCPAWDMEPWFLLSICGG